VLGIIENMSTHSVQRVRALRAEFSERAGAATDGEAVRHRTAWQLPLDIAYPALARIRAKPVPESVTLDGALARSYNRDSLNVTGSCRKT